MHRTISKRTKCVSADFCSKINLFLFKYILTHGFIICSRICSSYYLGLILTKGCKKKKNRDFAYAVSPFQTTKEIRHADHSIGFIILSFCLLNDYCSTVKAFNLFTKHLCTYHKAILSFEIFDPLFYLTKGKIQ